jgi:hypothetical protein
MAHSITKKTSGVKSGNAQLGNLSAAKKFLIDSLVDLTPVVGRKKTGA